MKETYIIKKFYKKKLYNQTNFDCPTDYIDFYTSPHIWDGNKKDNNDEFLKKFNNLKKINNKQIKSNSSSPSNQSTCDSKNDDFTELDNEINCFYLPEIYNNFERDNLISTNDLLFSQQINTIRNKLLNNVLCSERSNRSKEDRNILIDQILRKKDKRTTLMIRHIPNKYSMYNLLNEINKDFQGKYDIFYLPIDYKNNCNLGFAFINFVDPMHIILFYDMYRGKKWKRFNSDKICELAYAKFQGRKELINHFEKGCVLNFESEDKRPLILSPPTKFPLIKLPSKYFDLFKCIYPFSRYTKNRKTFEISNFYHFD